MSLSELEISSYLALKALSRLLGRSVTDEGEAAAASLRPLQHVEVRQEGQAAQGLW